MLYVYIKMHLRLIGSLCPFQLEEEHMYVGDYAGGGSNYNFQSYGVIIWKYMSLRLYIYLCHKTSGGCNLCIAVCSFEVSQYYVCILLYGAEDAFIDCLSHTGENLV